MANNIYYKYLSNKREKIFYYIYQKNMGTSEVITSKEENYKKLKLIEEGENLNKYGNGKYKLKICCISDTHEKHERLKIPDDIDILIYAGDFTNWNTSKEGAVNSFLNWFKNQKAKYI